jgi:hypothetical protein
MFLLDSTVLTMSVMQYSDVIRYITYAALGVSIPPIIMCFFLPNLDLPASVHLKY